MSHSRTDDPDWVHRHRQALTTRHTHEDVLTDREFELLLEACAALPEPRSFQARFICLVAGRLGLRAGEIAHFRTSWLDWDRSLLRIPKHESCACGYCRRQAAQKVTHHDELTRDTAISDRYDGFPHSRSTVNRRVNAAAAHADIAGRVYPRCLQATAASYHAYQGVASVSLQALMGWSDLATAQGYIRISGTVIANALRQVHDC